MGRVSVYILAGSELEQLGSSIFVLPGCYWSWHFQRLVIPIRVKFASKMGGYGLRDGGVDHHLVGGAFYSVQLWRLLVSPRPNQALQATPATRASSLRSSALRAAPELRR